MVSPSLLKSVVLPVPGQSDIVFDNTAPFVLIAGINVLESKELALDTATHLAAVTQTLGIPLIFKASFDKANRSSLSSFRGPGLDEGLGILQAVKNRFSVPILTDIHLPEQADEVAAVANIIQVPAFLARQTDLVLAAAQTGKVINVKKPQFLAPVEMQHIVQKCVHAGNDRVLLCERGTSFGYNNLVVDMLGLDLMKGFGPVIMDVTHALQKPGGLATGADGRRQQILALAKSSMAVGLAGLFLETHPDPDKAKCDGPCALPLHLVEPFLQQVQAIDRVTKDLPDLDIP